MRFGRVRVHCDCKRLVIAIMFAISIALTLHGTAKLSRANSPDEATIRLIQDTIAANIEKVQSFEITVISKDDGFVSIEGTKYRRQRTVTKHLWRDGDKWRQETESTVLSVDDGTANSLPFSHTKVFDGEKSIVYQKRLLRGDIMPGKTFASDLSQLLRYGYRVFGLDVRTDLRNASSIEIGDRYAEVTFAFPDEGIIKLWLSITNGFLVEKAEAIDLQGRSVGKGHVTGYYSLPGRPSPIKLCRGWNVEMFQFVGDDRKFLESRQVAVEFESVNEPIAAKLFHLDFPPGTRVTDKIKGTTYRIANESLPPSESSRSLIMILANIIVVVVIALYIVLKRRRAMR